MLKLLWGLTASCTAVGSAEGSRRAPLLVLLLNVCSGGAVPAFPVEDCTGLTIFACFVELCSDELPTFPSEEFKPGIRLAFPVDDCTGSTLSALFVELCTDKPLPSFPVEVCRGRTVLVSPFEGRSGSPLLPALTSFGRPISATSWEQRLCCIHLQQGLLSCANFGIQREQSDINYCALEHRIIVKIIS